MPQNILQEVICEAFIYGLLSNTFNCVDCIVLSDRMAGK